MTAKAISIGGGRVAYVSPPESLPAGWVATALEGGRIWLGPKASTVQLFAAGLIVLGQLKRMPEARRCERLALAWGHSFQDMDAALWRCHSLSKEAIAASYGLLSEELA